MSLFNDNAFSGRPSHSQEVGTSRALEVGELLKIMNDIFRQAPLRHCCVRGEVSQITRSASGHVYYAIKDLRNSQALLNCVLWKSAAQSLTFSLEVGTLVEISGCFNIYAPSGKLSFNTEKIAELTGHGDYQAQLEALKRKLADEGLFDGERKRSLPRYPRLIGVATSKEGAVIHDIQQTLAALNDSVKLLLYPCSVQGEGAEKSLIEAINNLAALPEVDFIIVARGGGSDEDLRCFNSEALARCIVNCPKPVLAAIGHAEDVPIAQLVADAQAETPTAAARKAALSKVQLLDELNNDLQIITDTLQSKILYDSKSIDDCSRRLALRQRNRVDACRKDLLAQSSRPCLTDATRLASLQREKLAEKCHRLQTAWQHYLASKHTVLQLLLKHPCFNRAQLINSDRHKQLDSLATQLRAISPLNVLERGFAIVETSQGVAVSINDISANSSVKVRLKGGSFTAQVQECTAKPTQKENKNVS